VRDSTACEVSHSGSNEPHRRPAPLEPFQALSLRARGDAIQLSWIEGFVNALLDPAERERRAKAVRSLRRERAVDVPRVPTPVPKPAYRWGWVLAAVTEVLKAAGEPMRAREIHAAAEELVGELVSWSSVKNCLASGVGGGSPRFERAGRGGYRLASDGRG
jgi:hypothetical protein